MARLFYNQDCTDFFYNARLRPGQGAAALDRFVEVLAGAGIDVLLCNTNAQLVNYASDVWQTFWDGFVPEGPDDQPLLRGLAGADPEAAAKWRHMIANMRQLHVEGVDYPARMIQRSRLQSEGIFYNARMNTRLIKKYCALEDEAKTLLKIAMSELGLSARAYDKILKVSRTISDLAESENIQTAHISEAIQYRSLDRQ